MPRVDAIMKRARPAKTEQIVPPPAEKREIFRGRRAEQWISPAGMFHVDGKQVDLSPKEYDLLSYMIRNRNIALTRERLISEVWGYDFFGDDRTLDTP